MALYPHQIAALDELRVHLNAGMKWILIDGSAGTGKTFLTDEIINMLEAEYDIDERIILAAPTHEALSVLKGKITERDFLEFATIHSGLKLTYKKDYHTGKESFGRNTNLKGDKEPFYGCRYCIIDESSMLGYSLVFGDGGIHEYADVTFIFVGDSKQLPPVPADDDVEIARLRGLSFPTGDKRTANLSISPVFQEDLPTVTLTKIVRQADDSPIIDLSYNIPLIDKFEMRINSKGDGFFYTFDRQAVINELVKANGSNDIKYLAFTNAEVNSINHDVRHAIYGTPNKVELGEIIRFVKPYRSPVTQEEFKTSQVIKVDSLRVLDHVMRVPNKDTEMKVTKYKADIKEKFAADGETKIVHWDKLSVKLYLINESIYILHESSEFSVQIALNKLMKLKNEYKMHAPKYHWFKEKSDFATIAYNHALTVHKSQGSTYGTSIINVKNIRTQRDKHTLQCMLYTAITRASKNVALYFREDVQP